MTLPPFVTALIERLEASGYETWVVGGAVRDWALGRATDDFDLATAALPDETRRLVDDRKPIAIGQAHGTLRVVQAPLTIDITTFRQDGPYRDHRHPETVTYTSSLDDDLTRRDLTINAMAYHPTRGLYDPLGGMRDLAAKRLRAVGDPGARLREDHLRVMRSLRFAATLGFHLDGELERALGAEALGMTTLSAERLGAEWRSLLSGAAAAQIVAGHRETLSYALPPLEAPRWFQAWRALTQTTDDLLRLVAFAYALTIPETWFETLGLSRAERRLALTLLGLVRDAELTPDADVSTWRWAGARHGLETLERYVALRLVLTDDEAPWQTRRAELKAWAHDPVQRVSDLAVDGDDLLALGVAPPEVGTTLKRLFLAVTTGAIDNRRDVLLELAERRNEPTNL